MSIRVGNWVGKNGSKLVLTDIHENLIRGHYQSKFGRPNENECFKVVGWTNNTLIGFTVLWQNDQKDLQSLTSWTGRYTKDDDGERMELVWHLCRLKTGAEGHMRNTAIWESFLTNTSKLYFIE